VAVLLRAAAPVLLGLVALQGSCLVSHWLIHCLLMFLLLLMVVALV
jgi:hypothetical protein